MRPALRPSFSRSARCSTSPNSTQKILASLVAGAFCLLISYIASERPNSESARALAALSDRLLAVEDGDLISPAPPVVRRPCPSSRPRWTRLFAEVRASIENAHALGMYDPVTSLPNRLHFRSEADKLLGEAPQGASSAMLFVDLDRFKLVNDSLGHARGDQLLIMVANRLRVVVNAEFTASARAAPLLARLAGDEFTLFFPEIESLAEIERVARRIALAISEPFELCAHSVDIGASIGVAICPDHGTSIESLMRAADIAMYRAKSSGGGQHCLFNADLAAEHQQKVETEKALTEAVQRGDFLLAFQPQMSLVTGEIAGAEALLRWNHPRDGLRMPGTLHSDRRKDRGDHRHRRLGDGRSRRDARPPGTATAFARRLAFNVSPRQIERADFFARLRQRFADAGVPLSLVELEFTESAAMEVSETVLAEIAALAGGRRAHRDRRFRHRLFEHRAAAHDAARPGQARPVADRRHRDMRKGAGHRPGGDPADQGRRLRDRRRSGRDCRPGRYLARDGLRHGPGLYLRRSRCSRTNSWPGSATPTAVASRSLKPSTFRTIRS